MSEVNYTKEEAIARAEAIGRWFLGEAKPPVYPDAIIPEGWGDLWIYLVTTDDRIKLGSSKDPDARLASLQSGHHSSLRLLATVCAMPEDETALHKLLREYRIRGEWFSLGPWLYTFMEGAYAGENAGMIRKRLEALQP